MTFTSKITFYDKGLILTRSNFLIFVFPLIILSLIFLYLPMDQSSKQWIFVGATLIDMTHVYSTFFYLGFSKQLSRMFGVSKLILYAIFTSLFLLGVFLFTRDSIYTWYVIAFGAIFHFIKQQAGWMKIAGKQTLDSPIQVWINQLSIYTLTGFTVIYRMTKIEEPHWFRSNDLPFLPEFFYDNFKYIFIFSQVLFLGSFLKDFFLLKKVSLAKIHIWLSTFIGWYYALIIINDFLLAASFLMVQHGFPYLVLIIKNTTVNVDVASRTWIKIILVLGGAGILSSINYFLPYPVFDQNTLVSALIFTAFFSAQFIHYTFDSFIWKSKYKLISANLVASQRQ